MTITEREWNRYIRILRKLSDTVADKVKAYVDKHGVENTKELIDYSYALVLKYGEGAAALSAQMYDAVAELEGRYLAPAEVAPTASYGEVAKAVNGTLKTSANAGEISGAVSRWVKMAGSDTTIRNTIRDGGEFAWIPHGDTCPFCLTLASRGWQKASKKALKNGHAEHIHANCDCQYAVRFDSKSTVAGYNPDVYKKMYYGAEGSTPDERINSMRRMQYKENADIINKQKRIAYAKREDSLEMFRKGKNNGVYGQYEELMSKKHVRGVVADMGLDPGAAKYIIDRDESKIGTNYLGHTSDDGKTITLFPDAFRNREQLVKTIGHENIHLNQVRKYGKVNSNEELVAREEEASASEEGWWEAYVKNTGYRQKH